MVVNTQYVAHGVRYHLHFVENVRQQQKIEGTKKLLMYNSIDVTSVCGVVACVCRC